VTSLALAEVFNKAISVLEHEQIPYFVYGGIAVAAWGEPAETKDVDVVIQLAESAAPRFFAALGDAGFQVATTRPELFFIDTWTTASLGGRDLDIALGGTEFDAIALQRSVRLQVFGTEASLITAEDLILYKLVAHRRKDLAHVEDILRRQRGRLDLAHLRRWANRIAEATGRFEVPATFERMLLEIG
jgi:hypothetical protein